MLTIWRHRACLPTWCQSAGIALSLCTGHAFSRSPRLVSALPQSEYDAKAEWLELWSAFTWTIFLHLHYLPGFYRNLGCDPCSKPCCLLWVSLTTSPAAHESWPGNSSTVLVHVLQACTRLYYNTSQFVSQKGHHLGITLVVPYLLVS